MESEEGNEVRLALGEEEPQGDEPAGWSGSFGNAAV